MAGNRLKVNTLGSGNTLDGDVFADALDLLGEKKAMLQYVAMHSSVHTALTKAGLIATERDKDNDYDFTTFGGRQVIMDDSLPVNVGTSSITAATLSVDATSNELRVFDRQGTMPGPQGVHETLS